MNDTATITQPDHSGTPADWRRVNEGRVETNPGCTHGMRFASKGCAGC